MEQKSNQPKYSVFNTVLLDYKTGGIELLERIFSEFHLITVLQELKEKSEYTHEDGFNHVRVLK